MRLVQDLLLVACLLFTFNSANAANLVSPLEALFAHIQDSLGAAVAGLR